MSSMIQNPFSRIIKTKLYQINRLIINNEEIIVLF
jgi:hypothetical protein